MEQVIFSCLTPGGSCEWFHLKDFVDFMNTTNGTSYIRSKCLDVYGPDDKQPAQARKRPEVLLESGGEVPIVIERKAVVWPSDFQRDHSKEHDLPEHVANIVGEEFNDSTYQLAFYADDLKRKNKGLVAGFGDQIGHVIISNITKSKSSRGIGSRKPIRWGFRPLAHCEIDEPNPTVGIRSLVRLTSSWDLKPLEFRQSRESALAGFAERFVREENKAEKKFDDYCNCKKLLVVQFFGESCSVKDEEIVEIVKKAQLASHIDQVWLTGREWVNPYDYQLAWERVR